MIGELTDEFTHSFPNVKSINSRGKGLNWKIYVRIIDERDKFVPIQQKWYSGAIMSSNLFGWYKVDSFIDGSTAKSSSATIVKSGKNIGKKNETNVFQQALKDALSKYNLQKKKSESHTGEETLIPPMLAKIYKPQPPNTALFVQRKYDGIRSLSIFVDGKVVIYSRNRTIYTSPYIEPIKKALLDIFTKIPTICVDGEIFNKDLELQTISGLVRTTEENKELYGDAKLYYKIYDVFDSTNGKVGPETFSERLLTLDYIKKLIKDDQIHVVDTYPVSSDKEVQDLYRDFREQKYEGAIVRLDCAYVPSYNSHHSDCLLKIKPLFDAEFPLVGYTIAEKGKLAGGVVLVCAVGEELFNVNPAATIEYRKELATRFKRDFDKLYKGRLLIVEYEALSKKGVPLRARSHLLLRDGDKIEKI